MSSTVSDASQIALAASDIPKSNDFTLSDTVIESNPFLRNYDDNPDDSCLEYDHYNGVTIHLSKYNEVTISKHDDRNDSSQSTNGPYDLKLFEQSLHHALVLWKQQGKKGIWIHVPKSFSSIIPIAIQSGFDFHMVVPPLATTDSGNNDNNNIHSTSDTTNDLVLSLWLPSITIDWNMFNGIIIAQFKPINNSTNIDSISRLPKGPSHQIGVGIFLLHPFKHDYMLVVQERTGPAARYQLWKMPTGRSDYGEDIHMAAIRELQEETGITAQFDGILQFRQSHPTTTATSSSSSTSKPIQPTQEQQTTSTDISPTDDNNKPEQVSLNKKKSKPISVSRKVSDLFIICKMSLLQHDIDTIRDCPNNDDDTIWTIDPIEIANIQWMSITDYCNQPVWQRSPTYDAMNSVIKYHQHQIPFVQHTVPLLWPTTTTTTTKTSNNEEEDDKVSNAASITSTATTETTSSKGVPSTAFYQSSKM